MFVPKHFTIVTGKGKSKYQLVAFDNALIDAGIGDYNLVRVSSIIPAKCQYENNISIEKGSIVYIAYASFDIIDSAIMNAAVAIAIPEDNKQNGVIFETVSNNNTEKNAINMCLEAMQNRNRPTKEVKSKCISAKGIINMHTCGIAAVVMW